MISAPFARACAPLLCLVALAGCGSDGGSSPESTAAAPPATASAPTTTATAAAASDRSDVVVVCQSDTAGMLEFVGYQASGGRRLFTRSYTQSQFSDLADGSRPTCSPDGWALDYTQYVGVQQVENNGTLPAEYDLRDPSEPQILFLGKSADSGDFAATEHNAVAPAFDADGGVWWIDLHTDDAAGAGSSSEDVYRDNQLVQKIPSIPDRAKGIPGDPHSFAFSADGDAEIVFTNAGGNSYMPVGKTRAVTTDPFGLKATAVDVQALQALVPQTELFLTPGRLDPKGAQVYFLGASPTETKLFAVQASGGSPKEILGGLPGGSGSGLRVIQVLSRAKYERDKP